MERYLWVFANDIGLPIYKQTSYVQELSSLNIKLALTDKDYTLTEHNIVLSTWISQTKPTTVFLVFSIIGLGTITILKRKK